MEKIHTGLIAFAILAALAVGLMAAGIVTQRDPAVVAAIAAQERAKAEKLEAEAATAQAQAAQANIETAARLAALPAIVEGKRWMALSAGIAVAVVLIGLAFAAVLYVCVRAVTLYPNHEGHWPIVLGRLGWQLPGLANGPAPLQIATQAQAAATMIGVTRASQSNAPVQDIAKRTSQAAQALPVPTFDAATGDGLKLVYVKNGKQSKAQREMQDVEEFVRRGWVIGLQRSHWLGQKFSGSGNKIGRAYYDDLMSKLARAGLVEDIGGHGWQTIVTLDEALDAFGLAHTGDEDVHQIT